MLQQTQVKTVIPYFKNFVETIPNLKALSSTSERKILKMWEGLGYYRRVKNLHKTVKILVKNYKGKLPNKFDEIKKLPGIGEYTANALLALVYNQPCIPFDGNIKRFQQATAEELETIDEIGPIVSQSTIKFWDDKNNKTMVNNCLKNGVTLTIVKQKTTNPLCYAG